MVFLTPPATVVRSGFNVCFMAIWLKIALFFGLCCGPNRFEGLRCFESSRVVGFLLFIFYRKLALNTHMTTRGGAWLKMAARGSLVVNVCVSVLVSKAQGGGV